ncbi:MAG: XdhC/CoxI family protein [Anaerolineales bacterium]
MDDIFVQLDLWRQNKENIAITTVVETWGSAPRPVGSKMVTTRSGGIAGSVSAGCVEGAVIEESATVMNTGNPSLIEFGVADETAWDVGLACGGKIKVFIEPGFSIDSIYDTLKENLTNGVPFLTITYLDGSKEKTNKKLLIEPGGKQIGDLVWPEEGKAFLDEAFKLLDQGKSSTIKLPEGATLFVEAFPLPPKLIIIGAVHLSVPLITIGNTIGFDTILIDPREAFASRERFPHVGQLVQKWPDDALQELKLDNSAYIVILTHDPKLDDPALIYALRSQASYVGALGSRRTNQKRLERLREAGITEEQLSRLHAPIGLDLGGQTSDEIAVSIMAEIVQVRNKVD